MRYMSLLIDRAISLSTLLSAMKLNVVYCELAAAAFSTVMNSSNLRMREGAKGFSRHTQRRLLMLWGRATATATMSSGSNLGQ